MFCSLVFTFHFPCFPSPEDSPKVSNLGILINITKVEKQLNELTSTVPSYKLECDVKKKNKIKIKKRKKESTKYPLY